MAMGPVLLTELLTAAGTAMANANSRLAAAGAPALLREAGLTLAFNGQFRVSGERLSLGRVAQPSVQALALAAGASLTNSSITISLIAAPAIRPVPPS